MHAKKVIVTGGTGFIGRHTTPILLDRGFEVHIISRESLPFELGLLQQRHPERVHHHPINLLKADETSACLEDIRATHLLHFAWDTRHGAFWSSPDNAVWVERSTALVRDFIRHGGMRMVGAGTCAEYAWTEEVLDEATSPLVPTTPYGQAKIAFRNFLRTPEVANNMSTAWGRIFHLFGPFEDERRLVASACLALLQGLPFKATTGSQLRDFSSTLDIAEGFVALLESDVQGDVNIASGEYRSVASILQEIAEMTGRPELLQLGAIPMPPNDPPRITPSVARLRTAVSFSSQFSVAHRLAETVEWWRIHRRLVSR